MRVYPLQCQTNKHARKARGLGDRTYTIVNCLPQFGPIERSMIAISNVLVFTKPKSQISFLDGTSYIDPSIDVRCLDILFNNITKNIMRRKEDGEPWRGGKEKNHVMIQLLIEYCCPMNCRIFKLSVKID